jgi:methyl-accepting chemotaxis protein
MNWKDLKLGGKLAVGFGLLIMISVLLGGLAVFNMTSIKTQVTYLGGEYVPEVNIAMEIERSARETMYDMRAYGLTEDDAYLQRGMESLQQVKRSVNDARKLANSSTQLVLLNESLDDLEVTIDS